jgi:glycerol uptake facilitator-like aquaporin
VNSQLIRRTAAEALGTAGLALAAFGGGHLATKLGASSAEAAIIGTLAVVGALLAILHAIGPLTGGHVNPAVTWSMWVTGQITAKEMGAYFFGQFAGAAGGAIVANSLWATDKFLIGSGGLDGRTFVAECVAAFALVALIHGSARGGNGNRLPVVVPAVVAGISLAAPFGIANPAITLAKSLSGGSWSLSTTGLLVIAELAAAAAAGFAMRALYSGHGTEAPAAEASSTVMTLELQVANGTKAGDTALQTALKVVERSLRPGDFAVAGEAGQLLVFVENMTEADLGRLQQRLEENLRLAALVSAQLSDVQLVRSGVDHTTSA